jgi:hypothetical protein
MRSTSARVLALTAVAAAWVLLAAAPALAGPTGMQCTNGPSFDLDATAGQIETPDGNSLFMWGYADHGNRLQYPGPVLCVTEGATVSVHLRNTLPDATSISFAGLTGVTATGGSRDGLLAREAASGGDVTYTFTASSPGTYLYQSGSDPAKQVEMGLFGALVVRPQGHPDWAYGRASTRFDPSREYLQLLDELDPDLHRTVETGGTYDITALHPRYYTINGRAFPDTLQANGVSWLPTQPFGALVRIKPYCNPGVTDPANPPACTSASTPNPQPALIRMLNAGLGSHPFHPHGNDLTMIGVDGRALTTSGGGDAFINHFGETVPSGGTEDFLLPWKDRDSFSPANPLPVAIPSYRNLAFRDNNTWYSGSPYLGFKGTLPALVTSQNACGELYFPWHSHALNEFTNYDASFGGMATLLRIDPIDGCARFPGSTGVLAGSAGSGSFSDLAAADSAYYAVNSTTTGTRTADWYGGFSGAQPGSANLKVTYRGKCSTTACLQTLHAWRWPVTGTPGAWVRIDPPSGTTTVATADVTRTASLPAGTLGTGSNAGKVQVRVQTTRTQNQQFAVSGNLMQLNYDAP